MPGKTGSSRRNRIIRLSRSSSLTRRARTRSSENWGLRRSSPKVCGSWLKAGVPPGSRSPSHMADRLFVFYASVEYVSTGAAVRFHSRQKHCQQTASVSRNAAAPSLRRERIERTLHVRGPLVWFARWQHTSGDGVDRAHMQVALREGNLNSGVIQLLHCGQCNFARDLQTIVFLHHPKVQLEIQGTLSKPFEVDHRLGLSEYEFMLRRGFAKNLQHDLGIGPVGHPDRQLPAALRFGQGPVDHLAGDKAGVRNDDFSTLECLDRAGANPDAGDLAGVAVDFDDVIDVNRPLKLQDQAGDKIVDDVLQAEAEADADRASEHGEFIQLYSADVDGREHHQQKNHVVEGGGNQLRQPARQLEALEDFFPQSEADCVRDEVADQQDQEETQNAAQGNAGGAPCDVKIENTVDDVAQRFAQAK